MGLNLSQLISINGISQTELKNVCKQVGSKKTHVLERRSKKEFFTGQTVSRIQKASGFDMLLVFIRNELVSYL